MAKVNFRFLAKTYLLLCCLFTYFGCSNDSEIPNEETSVNTEQQWVLSSIVDNGVNLTPREYIKKACYLQLGQNKSLKGYTGVNRFEGTYEADSISGKISFRYSITQLAAIDKDVMEFESTYMRLFHKITSFASSDSILELNDGKGISLKYQLIEVDLKY